MKRSIRYGKRIEGVLILCLLFVFLTGCNEVTLQDGINLQIEKEGGVTVTYIEDFPADYYDVNELDAMNREDVDEYNQSVGADVVQIISTETDGSKITLIMHYDDMEDYGKMNDVSVFSGTVGQAVAMGYDLDKSYTDGKDGEKATDINWEELDACHIVITNEMSTIHTYKNIMYATDNVIISDNKKMATVTSEEQSVIVFK